MCLETIESSDRESKDQEASGNKEDPASSSTNSGQCKYCWGSESTFENPCIVACKCTGSVGFIHFKCLKNWLELKATMKVLGNIQTIFWRNFECELCKQAYPYIFKVEEKIYKLVDIKKPINGNYLVLESLPLERNSSRTIHVLAFSAANT